MAYDPKLIYKKLAELLGGTKDQGPSRGEYMDVPGVGNIRVGAPERGIPKEFGGWSEPWDAMEIWSRQAHDPTKPRVPLYAEGQIPDWVKGAGELFKASAASGKADTADLEGLARHWLQGEGVNPFYKGAHEAMPAWVKSYLQGIMGGYVTGGSSNQTNPGPGGPGHV